MPELVVEGRLLLVALVVVLSYIAHIIMLVLQMTAWLCIVTTVAGWLCVMMDGLAIMLKCFVKNLAIQEL
jgi:hypothetical protein